MLLTLDKRSSAIHRAASPRRDRLQRKPAVAFQLHGAPAHAKLVQRKEYPLSNGPYVLQPIGWVESPLADRDTAPLQGDEGAPEAWLVFEPGMSQGLRDLQPGSEVIVLTWLGRARRDVLAVHPRGDQTRPVTGVFSTRSPDRPNPIGLHRVTILATDGTRMRVRNLEALDGTPIVDVKPVLDPGAER